MTRLRTALFADGLRSNRDALAVIAVWVVSSLFGILGGALFVVVTKAGWPGIPVVVAGAVALAVALFGSTAVLLRTVRRQLKFGAWEQTVPMNGWSFLLWFGAHAWLWFALALLTVWLIVYLSGLTLLTLVVSAGLFACALCNVCGALLLSWPSLLSICWWESAASAAGNRWRAMASALLLRKRYDVAVDEDLRTADSSRFRWLVHAASGRQGLQPPTYVYAAISPGRMVWSEQRRRAQAVIAPLLLTVLLATPIFALTMPWLEQTQLLLGGYFRQQEIAEAAVTADDSAVNDQEVEDAGGQATNDKQNAEGQGADNQSTSDGQGSESSETGDAGGDATSDENGDPSESDGQGSESSETSDAGGNAAGDENGDPGESDGQGSESSETGDAGGDATSDENGDPSESDGQGSESSETSDAGGNAAGDENGDPGESDGQGSESSETGDAGGDATSDENGDPGESDGQGSESSETGDAGGNATDDENGDPGESDGQGSESSETGDAGGDATSDEHGEPGDSDSSTDQPAPEGPGRTTGGETTGEMPSDLEVGEETDSTVQPAPSRPVTIPRTPAGSGQRIDLELPALRPGGVGAEPGEGDGDEEETGELPTALTNVVVQDRSIQAAPQPVQRLPNWIIALLLAVGARMR